MPNTTSFKFYTDSNLTQEFNSLYQLTHNSNQSDNPQDKVLYFGSTASSTQLLATSNPGVDDIVLTPTNLLAEWEADTAYSLGQMLEPTTPNTYVYRCTTAGTSDSMEPTFPTGAIGDTVADGTCVWTLVGKRHEITEVTLALDSGDLGTNTPGAALNVATSIDSGVVNAIPIHLRIINAVTTLQTNTGYPNFGININNCQEEAV